MPLYGKLAGLPSIRVDVGDDEVLPDDSLRYVEMAVAAGVDARVDVREACRTDFCPALVCWPLPRLFPAVPDGHRYATITWLKFSTFGTLLMTSLAKIL